jgi:hypothetical protein
MKDVVRSEKTDQSQAGMEKLNEENPPMATPSPGILKKLGRRKSAVSVRFRQRNPCLQLCRLILRDSEHNISGILVIHITDTL